MTDQPESTDRTEGAPTPGKRPIHPVSQAVGAKLRQARKQQGLSRQDASERLGTVAPSTLGHYESGYRALLVPHLYDIASAYGMDPRDLLVAPEAATEGNFQDFTVRVRSVPLEQAEAAIVAALANAGGEGRIVASSLPYMAPAEGS